MKDLKCISYDNLKNLMAAVQRFEDETETLDQNHGIVLWENDGLSAPSNAIIKYLDSILNDNASYFAYETNFGKDRLYDDSPYFIEVGEKSYPITDFDSWYESILAIEDSEITNDDT